MFQLKNVSKLYQQGPKTITALAPTTLDILAGEFVAVVGPSGSGKSTLLTILGGMLAPTQGKVILNGESLYDLSVAKRAEVRRSTMGFVFQSFNLVPYLSAQENVEVPLLLRGEGRQSRRTRAVQLLDLMGIRDRASHKPSALSTGQQQRVALARTLANDPQIILADEPTGNLDPETRNTVFSFLEAFHKDGKTIVMVTHDPEGARRATRVLSMHSGAIGEQVFSEIRCSA